MEGRKVVFHKPADAREEGIEIVYQDLALCDNLTAAENVYLGRELTFGLGPFKVLNYRAMFQRAGELFAELKSETRPRDLVRRMDRRSANANTEMSLIVDSPALASQVAGLLRNDRLPRSYQVRSTPGRQGIEWVSQRGKEEVVLSQEPNATAARRLRLQMLAAMVDEELL